MAAAPPPRHAACFLQVGVLLPLARKKRLHSIRHTVPSRSPLDRPVPGRLELSA